MEDSKHIMKPTRLSVKVPAGDYGARAGFIFLTNKDPTTEEVRKRLEQYDSWTSEDYSKFEKERCVWTLKLCFVEVRHVMECFDVVVIQKGER